MGDVRAADVERPGDRMGIGYDQRVGAQIRDLGADAGEFFSGVLAGEAQIMQHDRAQRRFGTLGPDRVDRVGLDCDQRGAGGGAGACETLRGLDRVQPRVVAEAVAAREILLDPAIGRRLDEVLDRKQRRVDLLARLQGIAPIDEQHRPLHEDDGGAGGAGKAGQPREPLLRCRHVFVLVAVGVRNDEAGQAPPCQFRAQRRHVRRAGGARAAIVERLEAGLEHGGNLLSRLRPGNASCRMAGTPVPGRM